MTRSTVLLVAALLVPLAAGCMRDAPPGPSQEPSGWAAFDADNAWAWVLKQVAYGNGTPRYRIPGTAGNDEVANLTLAEFSRLGWQARLESFTDQFRCNLTAMHNVVATLPGRSEATVLLGAHYDSRPFADRDPDPPKRGLPVLAANDGASGVAVLLDLARVLAARHNNLTYRIVLFDGEDGGVYSGTTTPSPSCARWAVGSDHHAKHMTSEEVARTRLMVLLDMVGDANLSLKRELNSAVGIHRPFQDLIWRTAANRSHPEFKDALGPSIEDDHLAFQDRRIPAVDLVHLDDRGVAFPDTWHTSFDDPAHMSRASLLAVGDTLAHALRDLDRRLA